MLTLDKVVAMALKSADVLEPLGSALSSDLVVANPLHRELVRFHIEFFDKHHKLPESGDVTTWLGLKGDQERRGLQEMIYRLGEEDLGGYTPAFVVENAVAEMRTAAAMNAVSRLSILGRDVTPEAISTLSALVEGVGSAGLAGMVSLSDVDHLLHSDFDPSDVRPSGIPKLDRIMDGGFRSELVSILADTGRGKTTLLMNFVRTMTLYGARALHITFELWAAKLVQRYYQHIAEADRPHYNADDSKAQADLRERLKHYFRYQRGSVHVLYRPAYSTTPEGLRSLVSQYVKRHGRLDVLALDYADLLEASPNSRGKGRDEIAARTYHMIRAICEEHNCTILNADQAVRGAGKIEHLGMEHMSNAYSKNRALDTLLAINQTAEEATAHQGRLATLKLRDHPRPRGEIPVYMNLNTYTIAELDTPDTKRMMAKFGHEPKPKTDEPARDE